MESVWNLLQKPYDTTQLTLGTCMLLHYLGKLQVQTFCRCGRKCKQFAFLIASLTLLFIRKFWYFRCLKYRFFPHTDCKWKFPWHCSFTYSLLWSICGKEIRHSRRHSSVCQQSTWYSVTRTRFWYKVCILRVHIKDFDRGICWEKLNMVVLISCWKSCGTQAQLTGGQAAADRAVPALKKTLRQLLI